MEGSKSASSVVRFGVFEADLRTCELRKRGIRIKIQDQPFRILALLLREPGALVTREEIRRALWTGDTFVDFDKSLNAAVVKLRQALGDTAENPRFIETVPRRGYRFLAPVMPGEDEPPPPSTASKANQEPVVAPEPEPQPPALPRRARNAIIWTSVALLLATVLLYFRFRPPTSPEKTAGPMQFSRVTGTGDVRRADISPDGKYVAYIREIHGKWGLWLRQLATDRDLEIASLGDDLCPGLSFSPTGDYIYFVRQNPLSANGDLYQVPSIGGDPKRILSGLNGLPAISPDGRRVAFVRSTLISHGTDSLTVAALDGSGERVLATYGPPGIHKSRVSWSPDGSKLAYVAQAVLTIIPAEGGRPKPAPGGGWTEIEDLAPLPSSHDLLVVGARPGRATEFQIHRLSLETGDVRQVTHDLFQYQSARSTAEGSTLLALQEQRLSVIEVSALGSEGRVLSAQNESRDGQTGLAWTNDGRLVYSSASNEGDREDLWLMDMNGNRQRITHDRAEVAPSHPAVSSTGVIAFSLWSEKDQAHIWRVDIDGRNLSQLTYGRQDFPPALSPDGNWIVYGALQGDRNILMKVSSRGGTPSKLTDYAAFYPAVSPDGNWIACFYTTGPDRPESLAVLPFSGGPPAKVFALPLTANISVRPVWEPDGRSVSFVNNADGVSNICEQPLAGGPPKQVTRFQSGKIYQFDWSRDGRLVLSRGSEPVDAVLIKGFR